jgi:hypothetical protein
MSERTLERWRYQRVGPPHLKVVGHVIYRVEDVEAYEAAQRRDPGSKVVTAIATDR